MLEERAVTITEPLDYTIPETGSLATIDGNLDEDFWSKALVWKMPYENNFGVNQEAPTETYVLMISAEENFLVAFVCLDQDPSQIRGTLTDRDHWNISQDDGVGLYIDTFGDMRSCYSLMVNARGVQYDAMRLDRGGQGTYNDSSFNFRWYSAANITDSGYIVEIAIPYRYLRLTGEENDPIRWNIMPFRNYPRDFVYQMIPFPWDFNRNCYLCQFPQVTITNPHRSFRPLQFVPYSTGLYENNDGQIQSDFSAGIDIKYQHPEWVVDATILPDFSQIETDSFVMTSNIRFLPRLSEQRPFFTERTDLFRFPISSTIYTRTILDPTSGLRWTGKRGSHNWAVLGLHDRATWLLFPERDSSSQRVIDMPSLNTLMRYRYDMSSNAVMGVFISDREFDGGHNRVISSDVQYAVGSRHTLVAQYIGTTTQYPVKHADEYNFPEGFPRDEVSGSGYLLRLRRTGRTWGYNIETRDFDDNFITGTGLQQQVGIRTAAASTSYDFWTEDQFIKRYSAFTEFNGTWDRSSHEPLNLQIGAGFDVTAPRQTFAGISFQYEEERYLEKNFALHEIGLNFSSIPLPWYQINSNLSFGESIDYTLGQKMDRGSGNITNSAIVFDRRLQLSHTMNYYRLSHQITAQDAWIHRARIGFQVTPRFSVKNILQVRYFKWKDPAYSGLTPDSLKTLENQTVMMYRYNYATAIYFGVYKKNESRNSIRDTMWQTFMKVSYLL